MSCTKTAEAEPCKIAESLLNKLFSQVLMLIYSCLVAWACMQAVEAWVECKLQALVEVGTWA